jgi:hypothetical protein
MSSIVSDSGCRGFAPSVVGGNSTGILVFPSVLGSGFNNGGTSIANLSQAVAPALVTAAAPQMEGIMFSIRGSGNVYIKAGTVLFKLFAGSSLTSTNNALIASCSAQTLTTSAYYPFAFSLTLQSDHNSGEVQVIGTAQLTINGGTVTFTEAESSPPTVAGIVLSGENLLTTSIPFCFSAQFGTGNAANQAQLQQFVLEA